MPKGRLQLVLNRFQRTTDECGRLANDARLWTVAGSSPHISRARRDSMIELAFLRGFLAWESFLEESFLLYMLGESPVRGRAPRRYVVPDTRQMAAAMCSGGKKYASWDADEVRRRAERFFRDGRPFSDVLQQHQTALVDLKIVRNAVAHDSDHAWRKFRDLVRGELNIVPAGLSIGSYLNTPQPNVSPPTSFLDAYLTKLGLMADQLVRL